ncbi:MAG: hypothetical protein DWQ01_07660 [Planctomycetota bacterium]|nr:MAG: hypothetical protein DWQ01_07660 [Planctomycetota bacterium]
MSTKFRAARFIKEFLSVEIVEVSSNHETSQLKVSVGNSEVDLVEVWAWVTPSVSIGNRGLAVWGGINLYFGSHNGPLRKKRFEDEILAAYELKSSWCVITELSVFVISSLDGTEKSRFDCEDVIVSHRWLGNNLFLQDFSQKKVKLEIDP